MRVCGLPVFPAGRSAPRSCRATAAGCARPRRDRNPFRHAAAADIRLRRAPSARAARPTAAFGDRVERRARVELLDKAPGARLTTTRALVPCNAADRLDAALDRSRFVAAAVRTPRFCATRGSMTTVPSPARLLPRASGTSCMSMKGDLPACRNAAAGPSVVPIEESFLPEASCPGIACGPACAARDIAKPVAASPRGGGDQDETADKKRGAAHAAPRAAKEIQFCPAAHARAATARIPAALRSPRGALEPPRPAPTAAAIRRQAPLRPAREARGQQLLETLDAPPAVCQSA